MKKIIFTVFLSLGLLAISANADEITIVSDEWCPINCIPGSENPGFMVETARLIFSKARHNITYKKVPWERAIMETRKGKYSAIIGAYTGDAPDFVFPDNEQGMIGNSFFIRKESAWTYNGIASLDKVKLGVIRGYDYGEAMNNYIKTNQDSPKVQINGGETALEKNIKKLLIGRIDVVLESAYVFNYKVTQMGVAGKIKSAGIAVSPEKAYIAFSPVNPKSKEYAEILSRGMDEVRKSGELVKIFQKYGLKDWK